MPTARRSEAESGSWRGRAVGVVFQFFQLLPTLTAAGLRCCALAPMGIAAVAKAVKKAAINIEATMCGGPTNA